VDQNARVSLVNHAKAANATLLNAQPLAPKAARDVRAIVSSNSDARALAHEWGHALHGAIHRSTSQHLAGTRGSTDAAELPATARGPGTA